MGQPGLEFPEKTAGSVAFAGDPGEPRSQASEPLATAEVAPSSDDHIERALAAAAAAGQWDVVSMLARELEARRLASTPNVVPLRRRR